MSAEWWQAAQQEDEAAWVEECNELADEATSEDIGTDGQD